MSEPNHSPHPSVLIASHTLVRLRGETWELWHAGQVANSDSIAAARASDVAAAAAAADLPAPPPLALQRPPAGEQAPLAARAAAGAGGPAGPVAPDGVGANLRTDDAAALASVAAAVATEPW